MLRSVKIGLGLNFFWPKALSVYTLGSKIALGLEGKTPMSA